MFNKILVIVFTIDIYSGSGRDPKNPVLVLEMGQVLVLELMSPELNKLWKKPFKTFTNCHVSWDTLHHKPILNNPSLTILSCIDC